uniref:Uncharacterized protein n=1 Tax=Brassica oleracea TaxID=3712 RepID=A0A3P6AY18_BRAOL|nr:unnamed protein product [Brassica oleracea]
MAMKRNGKSHVSSDSMNNSCPSRMSLGPHEAQLRFRLIHFRGGSEPGEEDTDWPRNAPHRRTGNCYSRIHPTGAN